MAEGEEGEGPNSLISYEEMGWARTRAKRLYVTDRCTLWNALSLNLAVMRECSLQQRISDLENVRGVLFGCAVSRVEQAERSAAVAVEASSRAAAAQPSSDLRAAPPPSSFSHRPFPKEN
ncbi:hypothetical protein DM860_013505 [Cuscuta australis]|uniref:Uncharacterized protein n=1 Tax=Cuscuta australis TaxID=267555 RepID=A0A328EE04_9ASTE|nr:hypothetical protein DM860_013505 [Cuscuta australis]